MPVLRQDEKSHDEIPKAQPTDGRQRMVDWASRTGKGCGPHLCAYCSENFRIISKLFVSFFSSPVAAGTGEGVWFRHGMDGLGGWGGGSCSMSKRHGATSLGKRKVRDVSDSARAAMPAWSQRLQSCGTCRAPWHQRQRSSWVGSSPSARTETQRRARRHGPSAADRLGVSAPKRLAVACMAASLCGLRARLAG